MPLGDVIIWSGEDNIEDTILPRFVAAGGDLGHVYPLREIITDSKDGSRPFDPSTDVPALIDLASKLSNPLLCVIDPVVMALPANSDSHKNAETRRGLQPLVDFAEQRGIALLGVTHFTKGTADRDPIERVTGSLAFGALPRCIWAAGAMRMAVSAVSYGSPPTSVPAAAASNTNSSRNHCLIAMTVSPLSALIGVVS